MENVKDIRPSSCAGRYYSADRRILAKSVDEYIASAELPQISGVTVGIIAPHAGHMASGPVAGYAFAQLQDMSPDVVVVASPYHNMTFHKFLTSSHSAYSTPLGTIKIDKKLLQELDSILKDTIGEGLAYIANDPEHSLEVELPFLQRTLKNDFLLLPLMIHKASISETQILGKAIAKVLDNRNYLLIASTDLSHYYPQQVAIKYDKEMLRRMEAFDTEGILKAESEGKGFACGRFALASIMWAAKYLGANKIQTLHHATSGDILGDFNRVVGYNASVILRT